MPKSLIFFIVVFGFVFLLFGSAFAVMGYQSKDLSAFLIGLAFLAPIIIGFLIYIKKKRKKQYLLTNGTMIYTDTAQVVFSQVSVNNRTLLQIQGDWHHKETNTLYIFKSKLLDFDPESYIENYQNIPVWINPNNPKEYIMDISEIENYYLSNKRRL